MLVWTSVKGQMVPKAMFPALFCSKLVTIHVIGRKMFPGNDIQRRLLPSENIMQATQVVLNCVVDPLKK